MKNAIELNQVSISLGRPKKTILNKISFNIEDVIIPDAKDELLGKAATQVDEVWANYNMGLITNNERYNQIIDIWTHTNTRLTNTVMNRLKNDIDGMEVIAVKTLAEALSVAGSASCVSVRRRQV